MSWFTLNKPVGTNYRLDTNDLMNTKRALNQLGYYDIPPHRGIDDWTDDAMFDGIKRFQKDNNLKVDAFMRPGGPTEAAMNRSLTSGNVGQDDGPRGGVTPAAGRREPGINIPSQIPQNQRRSGGQPQVQPPLPPGWKYEDDRNSTAWDPEGQLHRRGSILGFPRWEPVPGRGQSKQR